MLGVQDLDLLGKRVLVRVDFNVPMEGGRITDDTRIQAALPTIEEILQKGGGLVLMSHLGRPKDREPELSLKPVAERLSELLCGPVEFADEWPITKLPSPGQVLLIENLRFHPEEKKPTEAFQRELRKLADLYVNDAFGTAHRTDSSIMVAKLFDQPAAGFLLQKEIKFLGQEPDRPFYAIIGGAKVSSKLGIIQALGEKADRLFIGGAMAFTFMKALGQETGKSLVEDDLVGEAREILNRIDLNLPLDFRLENGDVVETIPPGQAALDVGPKTIEKWESLLADAKTILWNGPLGLFEKKEFAKGTLALAKILAESEATTIVGGGDSVAAINQSGLARKFNHISTGGGASLEYIEKGTLPGIEAISNI